MALPGADGGPDIRQLTHGGADTLYDPSSGFEVGVNPMYWLMPLGFSLGVLVVIFFEVSTRTWSFAERRSLFKDLTNQGEEAVLDAVVEQKLARWVDGIPNMLNFWTGGPLHLQATRETYTKAYEMLSLVSALLLAVCVTFYTSDKTPPDHLFGLVCCVANCALWLCTMSSAFFAVVINSCESDEQLALLVGLYGIRLMRIPMILFAWGAFLLYVEFVLFFKLNVDPGLNCSACLGACLVLFPLWGHCMHKLSWAAAVVHQHNKGGSQHIGATLLTAEGIRANFQKYIDSKDGNSLDLDKESFMALLQKTHGRLTSMQHDFATQMFDNYAKQELGKLFALEFSASSTSRFISDAASAATKKTDTVASTSANIMSSEFHSCPSEGWDHLKL